MTLKGKIDFTILTVREDEHRAVLNRFPMTSIYEGKHRSYSICRVPLEDGDYYLIAIVKSIDQGEGHGQDVARDAIEDLDPQWLLLVGIAGGVPATEFTLGDVVAALRLTDFSVKAALEGKPPAYAVGGGPMHKQVQDRLALLPAMSSQFGDWNGENSIGMVKPKVTLKKKDFYGNEDWKTKVHESLTWHFGTTATPRRPLVTAGAVASSDTLVKDSDTIKQWQQTARHILAVEMELSGVYIAARRKEREYPILAIRGISDIVGYKRHQNWTEYACHTAAAFARAFILSRPIPAAITRTPSTDESSNKENVVSEATPEGLKDFETAASLSEKCVTPKELLRQLRRALPSDSELLGFWIELDQSRRSIELRKPAVGGDIYLAVVDILFEERNTKLLDEAYKLLAPTWEVKRQEANVEPNLMPSLPDSAQYAQDALRQGIERVEVANPYLLGGQLGGRRRELKDLTEWLTNRNGLVPESRIICICDLGGTGKSALVWHWLNSQETKKVLLERSTKQFWCTFYARNYGWAQFLHDLAEKLVGRVIWKLDDLSDQLKLQDLILEELKKEKWLLVLDGLERQMGAFANPENYQIDSEEQDLRNECGDVLAEEKYLRGFVSPAFIIGLLETKAKVVITSRLFPENLKANNEPLSGVTHYSFMTLSLEDSIEVWNLAGDPTDSPLLRVFFERVGYHPQVISIVSAAVNESSFNFDDWFAEFPETDRLACMDPKARMTSRRHRWLALATSDLIQRNRDLWITLCHIVRRSDASSVTALRRDLVVSQDEDSPKSGRFRSDEKLMQVLMHLVRRKLVGMDPAQEVVDVHPVVRGHVTRYILRQYELPPEEADAEVLHHLELGDSPDDLKVRLLNSPDLEERFRYLGDFFDEEESSSPLTHKAALNILGKFYPVVHEGESPWLTVLPALSLRRDQAWCLLRTACELMTLGLWEESTKVFRRAEIAYSLCGDFNSAEECRSNHDWQALYNGSLLVAESHRLDLLEKGLTRGSDYDNPYWMGLLLAIRQAKNAEELLASLQSDVNRWTLQTLAEAWYYMERYDVAVSLAKQAWEQREIETESISQTLWEAVTLGLALVRLGERPQAFEYLQFAFDRGIGWFYNIVPMFALAGYIEYIYEDALAEPQGPRRLARLKEAEPLHKRYCQADPDDSFQIPASEAHLAMAKVRYAQGDKEHASELAFRSLRLARGKNASFCYASCEKRAKRFLSEQLGHIVPTELATDFAVRTHEERVSAWIEAWEGTQT